VSLVLDGERFEVLGETFYVSQWTGVDHWWGMLGWFSLDQLRDML